MRSPAAYYLLLLYATVMLKPLMPLVADAWDHTFSETIHIATIHAKYGANHLEKELAASEAGNKDAGKTQNTPKTQEPVEHHIVDNQLIALPSLQNILQKTHFFLADKLTVGFSFCQGPPPKS